MMKIPVRGGTGAASEEWGRVAPRNYISRRDKERVRSQPEEGKVIGPGGIVFVLSLWCVSVCFGFEKSGGDAVGYGQRSTH